MLRLQRLAHLYGVPVGQLLPDHSPAPSEKVRIGLARLAGLDSPDRDVLQRYVHAIQVRATTSTAE